MDGENLCPLLLARRFLQEMLSIFYRDVIWDTPILLTLEDLTVPKAAPAKLS